MSSFRPVGLSLLLSTLLSFQLEVGVQTCRADELRDNTSLKYAPADASFYATMLRNREQLEIFLQSNAYTRLRNLPLVNFGLSMWQGQWENPTNDQLRVFKEMWERDENQQLARLLLDAFSQEVFVYGDASWGELLKQAQEFQRIARAAQVRAARDDESDEDAENELIQAAITRLGQIRAPNTLIGFRISDPAPATAQIERLEKTLREFLSSQEDLQQFNERLKRQQIDGADFLTLSLDGTLIPWDQAPEESLERLGEAGRAAIEKLTLTVSLGIKDGYLLVQIGDSTAMIQRMGKGKLLIDQPKLAAVRKHAERRIVGISYASEEFLRSANSVPGQIDDLVSTIETLLPAAELEEADADGIVADVKEMARDVKNYLPQPGATTAFAFLTDRGYESFEYNWTEPKGIDGSQKLSLLRHLGGTPIGFAVGRAEYQPEIYDWLAKWASRGWGHARKIIAAKLDEEERARFEEVCARGAPLVARLDQATRKDLLPSLKDGQSALVLDARSKSTQWHRSLPTTRVALPMLELAMVCGVSDSVALKRAGAEYFAILQEALNVAHELGEGEFPKIELPPPQQEAIESGEIYSYAIPEAAGLDAQFAPNVGVSADALVLSLFPEQTKRMLPGSDPKTVGPLSRADQPLAGAAYFSFPALIDAIVPWVNYSVRIVGQVEGEEAQQLRVGAQMIVGNVTPILDLAKSLGEYASVTYLEDGAIVTHSATIYADGN